MAPCVGWYAIVHAPAERQAARLEAKLGRDIEQYRAYWSRKTRPLLRGEPAEGDAAEEARRIATRIAAPEMPDEVMERVAAGEPPPEIVALVEEKTDDLAALRATTRRRTAWTDLDIARGGAAVPMPDFMPLIRAQKLLAAQAVIAEPGECLRIAADAVRIAQDAGRGAGVLGSSVAAAMIEIVAPVAGPCLARASPAEREEAASSFALLATTAPDIGAAFELEALLAAATFAQVADAPLVPTTGEQIEQVRSRGDVLEAWEMVARDPAQFRAMRTEDLPEAIAIWEREARVRRTAGNPLLSIAAPPMTQYIELDMEAQARVRAIAVLAEVLADLEPDATLPTETPAAITGSNLTDPFTGDPLLWDATGDEACAYSAGRDGLDDGCSPASDDVGVRVTLDRTAE